MVDAPVFGSIAVSAFLWWAVVGLSIGSSRLMLPILLT
jgi:hypothetical protein